MSFRPAWTGPEGIRVYCEALSFGLRDALRRQVRALRDTLSSPFDIVGASEREVAPPEVGVSWRWDPAAGSVQLEPRVQLAEGRVESLPAVKLDAEALSGPQRKCLFSFQAAEGEVKAATAGVLREEPTLDTDRIVRRFAAGETLHVLGRLVGEDGGAVWSVVLWKDEVTGEERNLFAMELAVVPPDPAAVEAALGLSFADRVAVQLGLEPFMGPGSVGQRANGIFGSRTRSALRSWQQDLGVESTGYLTREQADALVAAGGEARAARDRDATAFASARRADTVEGYDEYLSSYPDGLHAGDARRLRDAAAARDRIRIGEKFRDCPHCPEMVAVPSGSFTMGSPSSEEDRQDDEGLQRRVTIGAPFAVGVYEVTFAEWDACVSGGGCGGYRPDDEGWSRSGHPVINVSWEDARSYVSWLSGETGKPYRLLSESEWEYAARGGTTARYWWGNAIGRNRANCDGCGSRWDDDRTAPVGRFSPNEFGLHDVHGNVWEWVEDCWHDGYEGAPADGSAWLSGQGGDCSSRVLRGGSWYDDPENLRSASRTSSLTEERSSYDGFRVARAVPEVRTPAP